MLSQLENPIKYESIQKDTFAEMKNSINDIQKLQNISLEV